MNHMLIYLVNASNVWPLWTMLCELLDNVVRAGLTPKFRDVQTLCSMLTYKQSFPEILRVTLNPFVSWYTPPFDEFEVDHCLLPPQESVVFSLVPGPSIFVIVSGEGRITVDSPADEEEMVVEGDVFILPAHSEIMVGASSSASGPLQIYRAGDGYFVCGNIYITRGTTKLKAIYTP